MSHEIILGRTEFFKYMGFYPPLSEEQMDSLPMPTEKMGCAVDVNEPCSINNEHDGSQTIGFGTWIFQESKLDPDAKFLEYAREVARHLGEIIMDESINQLSVTNAGSLFEPAAFAA